MLMLISEYLLCLAIIVYFQSLSVATALPIYSYIFEANGRRRRGKKELGTKQDAAVMFVWMRQGRGLKILLFKYYRSSKLYVSTNRNFSTYFSYISPMKIEQIPHYQFVSWQRDPFCGHYIFVLSTLPQNTVDYLL